MGSFLSITKDINLQAPIIIKIINIITISVSIIQYLYAYLKKEINIKTHRYNVHTDLLIILINL